MRKIAFVICLCGVVTSSDATTDEGPFAVTVGSTFRRDWGSLLQSVQKAHGVIPLQSPLTDWSRKSTLCSVNILTKLCRGLLNVTGHPIGSERETEATAIMDLAGECCGFFKAVYDAIFGFEHTLSSMVIAVAEKQETYVGIVEKCKLMLKNADAFIDGIESDCHKPRFDRLEKLSKCKKPQKIQNIVRKQRVRPLHLIRQKDQVVNGLVGLGRDVILRLLCLIPLEKRERCVRAIIGMANVIYPMKEHSSFRYVRVIPDGMCDTYEAFMGFTKKEKLPSSLTKRERRTLSDTEKKGTRKGGTNSVIDRIRDTKSAMDCKGRTETSWIRCG
ncbi:hypothetical protein FACS189449_06200 [Alphaproteobacteria bacterium]|nr:hypothetical protein FACS189449_06200 [Alphaproteobacteria bacterium]